MAHYSSDEEFYGFGDADLNTSGGEEESDIEVSDVSSVWSTDEEIPISRLNELDDRRTPPLTEESSDEDEQVVPELDHGPVKWTRRLSPPVLPVFDEPVGPVKTLDAGCGPLDFFLLLFPIQLFDHISTETNRYAEERQKKAGRTDNSWTPTTPGEFMRFLGMKIAMSLLELPTTKLYWTTDWLFRVPSFPTIMVCSRFDKLSQYFHVADASKNPPRGQPGHDKLALVRPILDAVQKQCADQYKPSKEQTIDEAMVAFKGRLSFKQYLPAKPTKFGIKVWERADPHTSYVSQFQVYTGKPSGGAVEGGLGARVVKDLTRSLVGKGHVVYVDSFFASPTLFESLGHEGILATGTCRSNRHGFPQSLTTTSQVKAQGDHVTLQKGELTATAWQDKRRVHFVSTAADPTKEGTVQRVQKDGRRKEVPAPEVAMDYGQFMGGVDHADQLRMQHSCARKSKKWWHYLFWFLVDTAIVNAFILMRDSPNHSLKTRTGRARKLTQLEFRRKLATTLVGHERQARKRSLANIQQEGEGHWPVKGKRMRCKGCLQKKVRTETHVNCKECKISLCIDCFEPFHKNLHRK